ncbi:MAG: hypothetical protein QOJ19_1908, partial [Acidimicrobiia bacterium]|nr:hypothetical protein [Acidimicrobiia bacterium]
AAPITGQWVKHTVDATVRSRGHTMTTADFNGDGRPDLLISYMADPYVTPWTVPVYLNPGPSGTWERIQLTDGGGHNLVAGDLNGDSRPDVFGSMYGGDPAADYPTAAQVPGRPGAFAWRNDTGGGPPTSTTTSTTAPTTTTTRATTTTAPTTTAPTTTTRPTTTTTAPTTTTSRPTTTTTAPTTTTTAPGSPVRYEAELANYPAGVDGNDRAWCPCSNNRTVGDFREPGEYITWNVNVPTARSYTLTWRYGAGDAAAPRQLTVNGTIINTNLTFAKTSTWSAWGTRSVAVNLKAGANSITLTAGNTWVYLNVDYMDVG